MICKNCGNNIPSGTICLRCGLENDEDKLIEKEEMIRDMAHNESKARDMALYKKWFAFLVIITIVAIAMEIYFNICVDNKGHSECGLGTLCDHECMPPFYFITTAGCAISWVITSIMAPILYIDYLTKERKRNKEKQSQ